MGYTCSSTHRLSDWHIVLTQVQAHTLSLSHTHTHYCHMHTHTHTCSESLTRTIEVTCTLCTHTRAARHFKTFIMKTHNQEKNKTINYNLLNLGTCMYSTLFGSTGINVHRANEIVVVKCDLYTASYPYKYVGLVHEGEDRVHIMTTISIF